MKQIWSNFFWSDWANDPGLRVCSLAAQGLWMRMLCVAASHDPPGYVAVNGKPLSTPELSRVAGCSETEAQLLTDELDRAGVFSRDRHGRIFNRRMVRDALLSRKRSKAGKLGAAITHGRQTENDQLPRQTRRQTRGNSAGKSLELPPPSTSTNTNLEPETLALSPRAAPMPEPGARSVADVVQRFAQARQAKAQRRDLDPEARKARWQQKVFAYAKSTLSDREYQLLVTQAADGSIEGRAWMNRLSDEMRAQDAEAERREA